LYFVVWVRLCGDRKDIGGFDEYLKFKSFAGFKKTGIKQKSE